ncbi:MAG: DUF4410 domain-containing protein [Pseudomonadota bacterium]
MSILSDREFLSLRQLRRILIIIGFASLQAACGSTSGLQSTDADQAVAIDLSAYQHVVLAEFTESASANKKFKSNEKGQKKKAEYEVDVQAAAATFVEYLEAELVKREVFESIRRGLEDGDDTAGVLVIGGDVTRYERGNAAAKFLVGLGAGSTYFDATVNVMDASSGEVLGQIFVDKNSWGLGGVISASQNVEGFMRGGAEKTAEELYRARFGRDPE